jgi:hypothetical protein
MPAILSCWTDCGETFLTCHSEERSDEESLFFLEFSAERFLASLGTTRRGALLRKLQNQRGETEL